MLARARDGGFLVTSSSLLEYTKAVIQVLRCEIPTIAVVFARTSQGPTSRTANTKALLSHGKCRSTSTVLEASCLLTAWRKLNQIH